MKMPILDFGDVPKEHKAPMHEGRLRRFGRYSWKCLDCGGTGSHPLGALPLEHEIDGQWALELDV